MRVLTLLRAGRRVAFCSDSGCPGISDPGYRLVRQAVEQGLPVEVIPGPSAVHVALLLSGLPTSSYLFKGYPPRKPGPRRRFFEEEADSPHTLVIFESPRRVVPTLSTAQDVLGDREAAVCIELTKVFERVRRGRLQALVTEFAGIRIRGEVTLVIAGRARNAAKTTART